MINTIILGHVLNVLPKLPAESVSCVTTSPPFWGLRDYGIEPVIWDGDKDCKHIWNTKERIIHHGGQTGLKDNSNREIKKQLDKGFKTGFCQKCNAWLGSLGLEPTFELYIKHLCDIFDEIKRVLRKDGTCWVNLGDTYWGGGNNRGSSEDNLSAKQFSNRGARGQVQNQWNKDYPPKSLCLIPQRFAIEMVNRGWILRNTIIWHKPNCMPSSANDRFTVDFEYLFYFTKNNKAIFWTNEKTLECVDKQPLGIKGIEGKDWEWGEVGVTWNVRVRDAQKDRFIQKATKEEINNYGKGKLKKVSLWTGHDIWFEQQFEGLNYDSFRKTKRGFNQPKGNRQEGIDSWQINPNGRNKRCVWTIPTQPFPEAHFAVYPEGLIEIPIKAGCPEFVCKKCGEARVKIYKYERNPTRPGLKSKYENQDIQANSITLRTRIETKTKEIGYTDCGCNAGWESGINLDPFMGAGTTALVALKQRKRFIGIEIKQEYIDMAYKRIAKVQQEIF